ncbi:MAG TPA: YlbF family regulator [Bacillota bacterium]|nr:YlbF family regulator [Bacillota bacterium]
MNPIEIAKSLAQTLKESNEFRSYQEAKSKVDQHEAARGMLEDFRKKQLEIYRKRANGEDITDEAEQIRKLSEIVSLNPYVREFLMAEYQWGQLMEKVNKTIAEGLGIDWSQLGLGEEEKLNG